MPIAREAIVLGVKGYGGRIATGDDRSRQGPGGAAGRTKVGRRFFEPLPDEDIEPWER